KIVPSTMLDASGKPLPPTTSFIKIGDEIVKGPVTPTNYVQTAKKLLAKLNSSDSIPDPDNLLRADLNSIINNSQTLDANGQTILKDRDFAKMWQAKQDFGDKAFDTLKTKADKTNVYYKDIHNAIVEDIEA